MDYKTIIVTEFRVYESTLSMICFTGTRSQTLGVYLGPSEEDEILSLGLPLTSCGPHDTMEGIHCLLVNWKLKMLL